MEGRPWCWTRMAPPEPLPATEELEYEEQNECKEQGEHGAYNGRHIVERIRKVCHVFFFKYFVAEKCEKCMMFRVLVAPLLFFCPKWDHILVLYPVAFARQFLLYGAGMLLHAASAEIKRSRLTWFYARAV